MSIRDAFSVPVDHKGIHKSSIFIVFIIEFNNWFIESKV
jgi:hypothetical protein